MIKERKRTYTQEEVNELKKWFDSQELPPTNAGTQHYNRTYL